MHTAWTAIFLRLEPYQSKASRHALNAANELFDDIFNVQYI